MVTLIKVLTFEEITEDYCLSKEGVTLAALKCFMESYYGDIKPDDLVTCVEFTIMKEGRND